MLFFAATVLTIGTLVHADTRLIDHDGACCFENGMCYDAYEQTMCEMEGGTWHHSMTCAEITCENTLPMGACCNANAITCEVLPEGDCVAFGGYYWGDDTDCIEADCTDDPWGACCAEEGGCELVYSQMKCDMYSTFYQYQTCEDASCPEVCEPHGIFDTVAYPLSIECGGFATAGAAMSHWPHYPNGAAMLAQYIKIDLDGDGLEETITAMPVHKTMDPWQNTDGKFIASGDGFGTLQINDLLGLDPAVMTYVDLTIPPADMADIWVTDFIDVTGDGLLDAIVVVRMMQIADYVDIPFYVINTSTPPAVACATDVNNDGATNVNDMLAIISAWGPCTP